MAEQGPQPSAKGFTKKETSSSNKSRTNVGVQGAGDVADKGPEVVSSREGQRTPRRVKSGRMPLTQDPIQPKVGK